MKSPWPKSCECWRRVLWKGWRKASHEACCCHWADIWHTLRLSLMLQHDLVWIKILGRGATVYQMLVNYRAKFIHYHRIRGPAEYEWDRRAWITHPSQLRSPPTLGLVPNQDKDIKTWVKLEPPPHRFALDKKRDKNPVWTLVHFWRDFCPTVALLLFHLQIVFPLSKKSSDGKAGKTSYFTWTHTFRWSINLFIQLFNNCFVFRIVQFLRLAICGNAASDKAVWHTALSSKHNWGIADRKLPV